MKVKFREETWKKAGETAGKVYEHLALEGPKNFSEIVSTVKDKEWLVMMALGWLAREDKIEFKDDGKVALKEQS